jgi:hypothetical protein
MPVVPIRSDNPQQSPTQMAMPKPEFALMAAAQMHSEGRLVKDPGKFSPTTAEGSPLAQIPEKAYGRFSQSLKGARESTNIEDRRKEELWDENAEMMAKMGGS